MVGFVVFSLMKFNKEKHNITLKGTNNPRYQYIWRLPSWEQLHRKHSGS